MTQQMRPSLDDPRVAIPAESTWYEPAPIPQTERQAEFLTLREGEMFVNMGPQHPSTHGVLRVIIKVNGEKVVDLDPVLGYLHRGVEKLCENADYHQAICYTDPLEYVSSLFCEAAPVAAFEKLMDVDVPRRAQYIRVLTVELNRIASHTLFQGWMALDLGGITPILWAFIERDEIVDMLAALTGQKLLYNYYRIGGVNGDLNHEFMSRLGTWMSRAAAQIDSNLALINENEIFVRRTRGLGVLDAKTALKMGVTGPNLRASGVPFDLRRDRPYLIYPELEFDVPTRDEGDSLARYLVRMDRSSSRFASLTRYFTRCPTAQSWRSCRAFCARDQVALSAPSKGHVASMAPTPLVTAPISHSACAFTTHHLCTCSSLGHSPRGI